MLTIDIKRKCPYGEDGRHPAEQCKHGFEAYLRDLYDKESPHYKECKHYFKRFTTRNLKYGEQLLTDESGEFLLTSKHDRIQEVSTYYSKTYDGDNWDIKKPLLLRIKNNNKYHWYENTGDPSNTKWENIPDGEKQFYDRYNLKGNALREKLNKLACQLHDLHFVDIHEIKPYECACRKYKDTVSVEKEGSVPGYTKYKHRYTIKPDSVRYNGTLLKFKYEGNYGEFSLDKNTPNLTVHYWDEDKERKIPLLMEVAVGFFGNGLVPLENDGTGSNNDNSNWTMILGEDGDPKILPNDELEEKLRKLTCKLFNQAGINDHYNDLREKLEKLNCECLQECTRDLELKVANQLQETQKLSRSDDSERTDEERLQEEEEEEEDEDEEISDTEDSSTERRSDVTEVLIPAALKAPPPEESATTTPVSKELLKAVGNTLVELGLYGPAIASALVPVGLGVAEGTLKLVNDLASAGGKAEGTPSDGAKSSTGPDAHSGASQGPGSKDTQGSAGPFGGSSSSVLISGSTYQYLSASPRPIGGHNPQSLPGQFGGSQGLELLSGLEGSAITVDSRTSTLSPELIGGHTASGETAAAISSGSGPGAYPHAPLGLSPAPSDSFWTIEKIIPTVSSVLGTSALACFAGWKLYNRYKGDPWVRQI